MRNAPREEFEMDEFRYTRGRPKAHPIVRLANRVWAVMLWHGTTDKASVATRKNWNDLENRLLRQQLGECFPKNTEAASLLGISRKGSDPRRLFWQLDANDLHVRLLPKLSKKKRTPPGRHADSHRQKARDVLEVAFDAAKLGEQLLPNSAAWLDAPLWWLAASPAPPLEQVRACIRWSLRNMGLVNVPIDQRRPLMGETAYQASLHAPKSEIHSAYESSLRRMAKHYSPGWLSLLSALLWESYLTDESDLLDIHERLAKEAFDFWLALPAIKPLKETLERDVVTPILFRAPLAPLRSTDQHDVLMSDSDWSSQIAAATGLSSSLQRLPDLPATDDAT